MGLTKRYPRGSPAKRRCSIEKTKRAILDFLHYLVQPIIRRHTIALKQKRPGLDLTSPVHDSSHSKGWKDTELRCIVSK
jgi:hypothetical protein